MFGLDRILWTLTKLTILGIIVLSVIYVLAEG